jgi:uncharacterized Zn finger protein (UPF0148 family)
MKISDIIIYMASEKKKTPQESLKDLESKVKKTKDSDTYMDKTDDNSAIEKWEESILEQDG